MEGNGTLTIPEVARHLNKAINTIYRYIKQKKLKVITVAYRGKKVDRVKKSELERFCVNNGITSDITGDNIGYTTEKTSEISGEVKRAIRNELSMYHKDFLEQVFNAGVLNRDNQFLKERVEVLHRENMELQERVKQLPDIQVLEGKDRKIKELEERIITLQQNNEKIIKQAEEEKKHIAEVWKKELEEARRPWWKFW